MNDQGGQHALLGRRPQTIATVGASSDSLFRRYFGVKVVFFALISLVILNIALVWQRQIAPKGWPQYMSPVSSEHPEINDLLDPNLYVETPGEDLFDQLAKIDGPYSMSLITTIPASGKAFQIAFQCDEGIIGSQACPTSYYIHFRGPIAYTHPPERTTFQHDAMTGRTVTNATLVHPGIYEVWAYPDWLDPPQPGGCPEELPGWKKHQEGPMPGVRGNGKLLVTVQEDLPPPIHQTRPCRALDYKTPLEGSWVSLKHVREAYREQRWFTSHLKRSNSLYPYGELPDYVYLPYQCKRPALDFIAMAEENTSIKHILYIGDSIQRTHFCKRIWPTFHTTDEPHDDQCDFFNREKEYHFRPARSFTYTRQNRQTAIDLSDTITFSQRFMKFNVSTATEYLNDLARHDQPVTHVVANIGMWFAAKEPQEYSQDVYNYLRQIVDILGPLTSITWVHTASIPSPIICLDWMKRDRLKSQSDAANAAINRIRDSYPSAHIRSVDMFKIVDSRPETSQDGRHWIWDGILPVLEHRPLSGRGDDAVHDWIWAAWLQEHREGNPRIV